MADPVSILGTVVGVASLAIQVSDILHSYWKGVSNFQSQVEQILGDTQQLSEVLRNLQIFLERDSTRISKAFTTTSTLYSANVRCEIQLSSLMENLRRELEGSKRRKLLKSIRWPLKIEETEKISSELRGYIQIFQFALSLDGCQLLLLSSAEASHQLQQLSLSTATTTQQNRDIVSVLQTIASLPQTARAIQKGVKQLEDHAQIQEGEKALKWLASDYASVRHQTIRKNRLAKTGEWFFAMSYYREWQNAVIPILWVQGKPGVGKSVLLSCIADKIAAEASIDQGVAYFYCEYSQANETQAAPSIIASLTYQLVLQLNKIPTELLDIYQNHRRQGTRPDLEESISLLRQIGEKFSRTWLLIDALDELDPNNRDDLIEAIETLKDSVSFFITSRPQSIDSDELKKSTMQCTLSAHAEDLTAFIRNRMGKAATASRRVRESPGWDAFVDETVEKLVYIAEGMFILVSLQLEMLLRPRNLAEMQKLLKNVSVRLDDFYANTLARIKDRESEIALKVLCWLVQQKRPLSAKEIQEALAVSFSTTHINTDAFIHEDDIVDMSCGFVTVDEDGMLSLSHATVHEFLVANLDDVDRFNIEITRTCLQYLSFSTFEKPTMNFALNFPIDGVYDNEYDYRVLKYPFFSYAARYWSDHFIQCPNQDELIDLAIDLINGPNVTSMLQAFGSNTTVRYPLFTPMHVAAFLGIPSLIEFLIARAKEAVEEANQHGSESLTLESLVDSTSAFGNTPLLFAVKRRHYNVAKALLDTGAVNPSVMDNTIIRWALEWKQHDLLHRMVKLPRFNEQLARRQFGEQIKKYLSIDLIMSQADDGVDDLGNRSKNSVDIDKRISERREQRRLLVEVIEYNRLVGRSY